MPYFDSTTLAAIATGRVVVRTAIKAAFAEANGCYWSDAGPIENPFDGLTYTGNCSIGAVDGVEARSDLAMADLAVKLSAADAGIVTDFKTLKWHFRRITITDLLFDPVMRTIYPTPLYRVTGLMEKISVPRGEATINLAITDLMRLSVMNSAGYRSPGDQKGRLETDTILDRVTHSGRQADFLWGTRHASYGNAQVRGLPATKGP